MRRSFPTFRRWAASWRNRFRLFLRHEPSLVDNDRGRQRHRLAGSVYVLDADMLEAALPGHENPRHLPDGRPHAARPHDAIALPDLDRFARSQNSAFPRPSPWSRPRDQGLFDPAVIGILHPREPGMRYFATWPGRTRSGARKGPAFGPALAPRRRLASF